MIMWHVILTALAYTLAAMSLASDAPWYLRALYLVGAMGYMDTRPLMARKDNDH